VGRSPLFRSLTHLESTKDVDDKDFMSDKSTSTGICILDMKWFSSLSCSLLVEGFLRSDNHNGQAPWDAAWGC
jgi:hypothetical protein